MKITMSRDAAADIDARQEILAKFIGANVEVTTAQGGTFPWGALDDVSNGDIWIAPDDGAPYPVNVMEIVEVEYL